MRRDSNLDTIVAVSTPVGEGGIGIVRLSGKDAVKIASEMFVLPSWKKVSKFKTHTVRYGYIVGAKKKIIDEVLLNAMLSPKTYTKENTVEINCHGGLAPLKKVLELTLKNGARIAEPGEFTKRAFLNGRLDLTQAEAVLDIIRAKTDLALKVSMGQLEGELSGEINLIRDELIDIASGIEATIDFPEEDIEKNTRHEWTRKIKKIRKNLQHLSGTYYNGAILKNGITAAICGRTNVGKSSLMNLLLKRDRVIVTHIPGTTRDAIEEMINIKGLPIRLVDTAGIRKKHGIIEREGISKSRFYLSSAELVLCVLDGSQNLKKDDLELLKNINGKSAIIVINKSDLKSVLDIKKLKRISGNKDIIKISCLNKKGIDTLEDKIYNKIWSGKVPSSHEVMLNSARHKDAIDNAVSLLSKALLIIKRGFEPELLSIDIRESLGLLGEIVGETYTEDILNVIFSKFCIGK